MDSPSTEQLELFEPTLPEMVQEFIKAFDANTDQAFALKLVAEETQEVLEAAAHLVKEVTDLAYVITYAQVVGVPGDLEFDGDTVRAHRWLVALTGFVDGLEAFKRVHRSNMSKLGDDGKPLRREDGKILKGPNYREPYLLDLV